METLDYSALVPVTGVILSISGGNDCCSQRMSLRTENGTVNFTVDPATQIIESRQLRPGMRVAAFYDSRLPVPLIYPPHYRAQLITLLGRNEYVTIRTFDEQMLADDRSLRLNIARSTVIKTVNGQNFSCGLGNRTLLVYYSVTTRSLPPQTTPRKIIVLC